MRNPMKMPAMSRLARVGTASAALTVLGLVLVSGSLGAAQGGLPRLELERNEIFSTRVAMLVRVFPEYLSTNVTGFYSEHPNGPWTQVDEQQHFSVTGETFDFGTPDDELYPAVKEAVFLRHLKPETQYYARFVATNADGTKEEEIPFETLPVGKPEIDRNYNHGTPLSTSFAFNPAVESTDTSQGFIAKIDTSGASTAYNFEYSEHETGPWQPFTSGATGTISEAEEYKWLRAGLSGLKPETTYYVRLRATNSVGETIQDDYEENGSSRRFFTTPTAKPGLPPVGARNVTASSAYVHMQVIPHGSETTWALEYAEHEAGPWIAAPGGSGKVSLATAEATPYGAAALTTGVRLTGLSSSTTYYVRASSANTCAKDCGSVTGEASSFTTEGPPTATVFVAHAIYGESLRLLGEVNANSSPTSAEQVITPEGATGGSFTLGFNAQHTASIAYDASAETVRFALENMPGGPEVVVEGSEGGPYTVTFRGQAAGKAQPLIEADGAELSPAGAKVAVAESFAGGVAYETHSHFQYVSEQGFAEHGWAEAQESPDVGVGALGYDLPNLTPGETYRYRIVAQSNAPGTGLVESAEESLSVPLPPAVGGKTCPNEAFRTGPAAHLPDCRAYEQLTPVEKEGARELFNYGLSVNNYVAVAEDGRHALLEAVGTDYLTGPEGGGSPYLFTRQENSAWSMLTGTAQPEAGVERYTPQVYSADLSHVALEAAYATSLGAQQSEVEYKVGPVGGPYTLVKTIPRAELEAVAAGEAEGWVAGDPSLSKLIFATPDHEALGEPTGTKSGSDLYEYTSEGGLRQMNVIEAESGETVTIGSCGANVAVGYEYGGNGEQVGISSSPDSLSSDGSRVFFEAVPGKRCGEETPDLYMRVNGSETVEIGAYKFVAAKPDGTLVLVYSDIGAHEALLYDTENGTMQQLPESSGFYEDAGGVGAKGVVGAKPLAVAANLSGAYYTQGSDLYWYDLQAGRRELLFELIAASESQDNLDALSADGRYFYFMGAVAGLPGGGPELGNEELEANQVYRYDSVKHEVECVSCASPYDPQPRLPAYLYNTVGKPLINGALPLDVSGSGGYLFFTTPAALLPEDIDGEIRVDHKAGTEYVLVGEGVSPSSDIYEWRAQGVSGCTRLAGCVALISGGRGGYMTVLLGSADEGRDVYIYTREQLGSRDVDTAGDIYDARIDGEPAPPAGRPSECEADSCASPPAPPLDATPSSLTFSGAGNVLAAPPFGQAGKSAGGHAKKKKKGKRRRRGGRARRRRGRARTAPRAPRGRGRSGR